MHHFVRQFPHETTGTIMRDDQLIVYHYRIGEGCDSQPIKEQDVPAKVVQQIEKLHQNGATSGLVVVDGQSYQWRYVERP
jgi:hypothetical protein